MPPTPVLRPPRARVAKPHAPGNVSPVGTETGTEDAAVTTGVGVEAWTGSELDDPLVVGVGVVGVGVVDVDEVVGGAGIEVVTVLDETGVPPS